MNKKTLQENTHLQVCMPNLKNTLLSKWRLIENEPLLRKIYMYKEVNKGYTH